MRPEERQDFIARAAELQREGWRNRDIADELGVTKSTVSRWLHRAAVADATQVDVRRLRKPVGAVHGVMRPERLLILYRFFDAEGRLLYVGQSVNVPTERFAQHANDKAWWRNVATITLEHVDGTGSDLDRAERKAYLTEHPMHNQLSPPRPEDGELDLLVWHDEV